MVEAADVAVPLISPDYIASDDLVRTLDRLHALTRDARLVLLPIVIRPCTWKEMLRGTRPLPSVPPMPSPEGQTWDVAWLEVDSALRELTGATSPASAAIGQPETSLIDQLSRTVPTSAGLRQFCKRHFPRIGVRLSNAMPYATMLSIVARYADPESLRRALLEEPR